MTTHTTSTPERLVAVGNGIELCVQTHGERTATPLLLIHGLGMQLVGWPQEFLDGLVARGFFVIRFDNRDIGRSTRTEGPIPTPLHLARRRFHGSQYDLADMAQDTANLIDALELGSVHVAGVSMGGMIAQTLAARHPEGVRSLVSIMSTTGSRKVGQPARSTLLRMAGRPSREREASVKRTISLFRHIRSAGFPFDEAEVRREAELAFDRGHNPDGPIRQIGAILKSGSRRRELASITAPTLVVHGSRDRMVNESGGQATADAIPGAQLISIAGMGHDLPRAVRPRLAALIADHAVASDQATA